MTSTTIADSSSSSGADSSSSGSGVDSSSSSGAAAACGDGTLDDGEECDDGNTAIDDACTATCTVPYEIVWQASHNGSASNFDSAADVLVDADGNSYVLGRERVTDQASNLWLQQYMADGTEGWTVSFDGTDSLNDSGAGLTMLADGDFVVVGTTESTMTGDDILILRLDGATQMVEWQVVVDGPGEGPGDNDDADSASDVAIDADGNIYVSGSIRIGTQDWDFWLGKYDDAGNELWTATYAGAAGARDFTRTVQIDDAGVVWLLGNERQANDDDTGIVLAYDADGVALDADTHEFDHFINDMAFDADGNVVVVGSNVPANTFNDFVTAKYDDTWTELWSVSKDLAGSDDFPIGLSVGASGNVYVAGAGQRVNESFNAVLVAYDADGAPLWGDEWNVMDADLDEQFSATAEDASGDLIVVGYETVLGEQSNALVRKYHAL